MEDKNGWQINTETRWNLINLANLTEGSKLKEIGQGRDGDFKL